MIHQNLRQAYLLEAYLTQIMSKLQNIIHTTSCMNPCRLFIHDNFFGPLGLHLQNIIFVLQGDALALESICGSLEGLVMEQ